MRSWMERAGCRLAAYGAPMGPGSRGGVGEGGWGPDWVEGAEGEGPRAETELGTNGRMRVLPFD